MRKFLIFLSGLLVGLWTGATLSLLFTPQSGEALQNQIRDNIERLVEEGRDAAETRRQELEEQLESFKQGRPITLQTAESPVEAA